MTFHSEVLFRGTRRFQVLRRLGEGGMGVVYEALDLERQARVALKTLRILDGEALLRFKHEFRALQDLEHPNLVSLGELIEEGGVWFYTMELVAGVDFLSWVRPGHDRVARPLSTTDEAPRARSADTMQLVDGAEAPVHSKQRPPLAGIPGVDEARLRPALAQLVEGLHAIHAAGKIHRDIKPSNILVTAKGRVVLLDFGLATTAAEQRGHSDIQVVGTIDYMAPEQAAGKPVGAEADFYAVGVLLYEALTGRVPFSGPSLEVIVDKQRFEPPPPLSLLPALPADLDALCGELLRVNPALRPTGAEILSRLRVRKEASPKRGSTSLGPVFVGRDAELGALRLGFASVRKTPIAMLVHGESGVGKSALVRHFVERLGQADERAVVLAGRCYERESVPYKAFDGVVDALASWMKHLAKADAAVLLPRQTALLTEVFPVLRRVEAAAQAPRIHQVVLDPQELRIRVFAALRDLLARISDRHPLVVVIDDLQWADADSMALLREILHPPEAPKFLLVATVRTADTTPEADLELPCEVRRLALARLLPEEAKRLAMKLSGDAPYAAAIAEEANGHPLFIDELVRHAQSGAVGGPVRLDDALLARVSRLEPAVRLLVELVAVAGGPLLQEVAADALSIDFGAFARHVALLRASNLVRTSGTRSADRIEPYHDRVRESIVHRLGEHERRGLHQKLALALEGSGRADPEALVVHWRGAGDARRAAGYAAAAAEQAARTLAFDRAARLYRLALELGPLEGIDGHRLQVRLGEALVAAGRGGEAAEAFLLAAVAANPAEALDLRRRAAEQLIISGHIDDGLQALESVLAAVGMKMPQQPTGTLLKVLGRRIHLRLRGVRFRERDASLIPPGELTRIDVCWSVAMGLGLVDTLHGAYFQAVNLLLSLRAGEPYRVARSLALEASYLGTGGGKTRRRTDRLASLSSDLARRIDHPHAIAMAECFDGGAAYLQGRWKYALERMDHGGEIFRDRCTGVSWELDSSTLFGVNALAYLGRLEELSRRVALRLREAQDRGDLYAAANLRLGYANLAWLMRDDVAGAHRVVADALAQWTPKAWHVQHYYGLMAQVHLDFYQGDPARALERIRGAWPKVRRALQTRVQFIRIVLGNLHGQAACAAGNLAEARRALGRVRKERMPWGDALAAALEASILQKSGNVDEARKALVRTVSACEAADMGMLAQVTRRALGDESVDDWMHKQGIRLPSKLARVFLPVFFSGN
jgi:serine/threonine protein kinase/tetratricopeptide (TPR) repeat protein